jgi:hypothetical protein
MCLLIGKSASVYRSYDGLVTYLQFKKAYAEAIAASPDGNPRINRMGRGSPVQYYQYPAQQKLLIKDVVMVNEYLIESPLIQSIADKEEKDVPPIARDLNDDPNLIVPPARLVKTTQQEFDKLHETMMKDPAAFAQALNAANSQSDGPKGDHIMVGPKRPGTGGKAVPNASINLKNSVNSIIGYAVTDAGGAYSLQIPAGTPPVRLPQPSLPITCSSRSCCHILMLPVHGRLAAR